MTDNKKLYIYSGLAIALAVAGYLVMTKRKPAPLKKEDTSGEQDDENNVITLPSGSVITNQQALIEPTLAQILKLPLAEIKLKMLNKNIYTKVENVNPRQTPYVNNGWFVNNGVGGRITEKGTFAGTVLDVQKDLGSMANRDGKVYNWFKLKPSPTALNQIREDSNILLGSVKTSPYWLREDVITII
jgi:hypothetical protein